MRNEWPLTGFPLRKGFPFSRLREKVPEGRMRVSLHNFAISPMKFTDNGSTRDWMPNTLIRPVGHLLPQAGEGESGGV